MSEERAKAWSGERGVWRAERGERGARRDAATTLSGELGEGEISFTCPGVNGGQVFNQYFAIN